MGASTCAYSAPLPSICGHGQSLPCLGLGLLWLRRSTGPALCLTRLRRTRLLTAIRLARLLATTLLLTATTLLLTLLTALLRIVATLLLVAPGLTRLTLGLLWLPLVGRAVGRTAVLGLLVLVLLFLLRLVEAAQVGIGEEVYGAFGLLVLAVLGQ